MDRNNELCGLRGWLILVGIGVVISPFRLLATTVPVFYSIFSDGTWQQLVTPGGAAYNPLWIPLLAGEITYNLAMLIALIAMNFLYFSKHRFFPKLYIAIIVASLCFIPLDAWVVSLIVEGTPVFGPETATVFGRSLISGLIWIPYMLKSERVKATFTRGKSADTQMPADELAVEQTDITQE